MKLLARPHQMPTRLAAGAYILNSGLSKHDADDKQAAGYHGMATTTYAFLGKMDPVAFTRLLSRTEMALGVALVTPFVPSLVAGAALAAFAGGLLGLYLRTPGMRREGDLRPTEQGIGLAKDVWLMGIGLGMVAEELGDLGNGGRRRK
jgi:hypothetical protein